MNKRDREQLRASIARDLIEGQGAVLRLGSYSGSTRPSKESPPHQLPKNHLDPGIRSLWKTAWQEVPPWHGMKNLHGTVPRWHRMPG